MKLGPATKANWLEKKDKRGFRGYPIGTIAFYEPRRALRHQGRQSRREHDPTVRAGQS